MFQQQLPFLGRDVDLRLLELVLARAAGGTGSVVLISGEAGIGKTRLCQELSRSHRGRGGQVLPQRALGRKCGRSTDSNRPATAAVASTSTFDCTTFPRWRSTSSRSATGSSGSSTTSARSLLSDVLGLPADETASITAMRQETREMDDSFDMMVIGAGPAGEKAAAQAAFYGKRVAVVDRAASPGGSAVRSAGVPTLTLRETASYLTGFRRRDTYGLSLQLLPSLALDRLLARTAEVVATRTEAVRANLDRHGVQLLQGEARLGPGRSVIVRSNGGSERTLQAGVILIATGSQPLRPPEIPFDDPDVHDSEGILGLDRIPRTMVVIGGGPVGCEYASVFTALGVEVTLLDQADRVLPFMDAEISAVLAGAFADMGMRLALGSGVGTVARVGGELRVTLASGERLHPEKVLFVAGRTGVTEGLGLPEAGVEIDARGRIVVDDTYRTTAEGIYAAGDVIGPPALASVSMEQGRVAATHAFGIPFKRTLDPLATYGIYSIPEAAMVGMTEQAATEAGIDYEVGRAWFERSPRAQIAGSTEGLIKLVFRRDDRRLLGVHIVGELAAELIHQGQGAIGAGEPIDTFIDRTFNIPTFSETYKYAAYDGLHRLEGKQP